MKKLAKKESQTIEFKMSFNKDLQSVDEISNEHQKTISSSLQWNPQAKRGGLAAFDKGKKIGDMYARRILFKGQGVLLYLFGGSRLPQCRL